MGGTRSASQKLQLNELGLLKLKGNLSGDSTASFQQIQIVAKRKENKVISMCVTDWTVSNYREVMDKHVIATVTI